MELGKVDGEGQGGLGGLAEVKWDPRSQSVARADLEKPGDRPKDLSPPRPTQVYRVILPNDADNYDLS